MRLITTQHIFGLTGVEPSIFKWSPQPKQETRRVLIRQISENKENLSPKHYADSEETKARYCESFEDSSSDSPLTSEADHFRQPKVTTKENCCISNRGKVKYWSCLLIDLFESVVKNGHSKS